MSAKLWSVSSLFSADLDDLLEKLLFLQDASEPLRLKEEGLHIPDVPIWVVWLELLGEIVPFGFDEAIGNRRF